VPRLAALGARAVKAVLHSQLLAIEEPAERERRTDELRAEYPEEIDILYLAYELEIDAVVQPGDPRSELVRRIAAYASRERSWSAKLSPVRPLRDPFAVWPGGVETEGSGPRGPTPM
jgi:methylmalonyl-CoA decarboxylase subunit alpha